MIVPKDLILSNGKEISEKIMEVELEDNFLTGITEATNGIIEFGQLAEILLRHVVEMEEVLN